MQNWYKVFSVFMQWLTVQEVTAQHGLSSQ